jgi:hypothetical protein
VICGRRCTGKTDRAVLRGERPEIPQGLKPQSFLAYFGATEVVAWHFVPDSAFSKF